MTTILVLWLIGFLFVCLFFASCYRANRNKDFTDYDGGV